VPSPPSSQNLKMTFPEFLELLFKASYTGKVILHFRGGRPQGASGSQLLRTEFSAR
jgi:hypothetical protein